MTFKQFRKKKLVKITTNRYVLILVGFSIWMLFFDGNSYLVHKEFNSEIKELETAIEFYKKRIEQDKIIIKTFQDSLQLERFAREKYLMKKENEDIYLIEFDTIK
ncbi:MAG: cell division protein DivIC [Polaribacter sp.]|jgi:cell division protein DivIC